MDLWPTLGLTFKLRIHEGSSTIFHSESKWTDFVIWMFRLCRSLRLSAPGAATIPTLPTVCRAPYSNSRPCPWWFRTLGIWKWQTPVERQGEYPGAPRPLRGSVFMPKRTSCRAWNGYQASDHVRSREAAINSLITNPHWNVRFNPHFILEMVKLITAASKIWMIMTWWSSKKLNIEVELHWHVWS